MLNELTGVIYLKPKFNGNDKIKKLKKETEKLRKTLNISVKGTVERIHSLK